MKYDADTGITVADVYAVIEYVLRHRNFFQPRGKYDERGCWHPDCVQERRQCCDNIRPPSRRFPKSLLTHCYTLRHCAALYNADVRRARLLTSVLAMATTPQLLWAFTRYTAVDIVEALYRLAPDDAGRMVARTVALLLQVPDEELVVIALARQP